MTKDSEVKNFRFEGVSLEKVKSFLLKELQSTNVFGEVPKYNAFEVENFNTRENFTFVKRNDCVICYNTSRGAGNVELFSFGSEVFPEELGRKFKDADKYYLYLFHKALSFVDNIGFIGYVDDKTFEPIEE